jgi:RNA polymerase sigma factor for flagellar operon FliA
VGFIQKNPSEKLKKQIVLNYINLVHYVIHRTNLIQNNLLDRRDFFQFGVEGLSEAIDRFDPDYGTKFETYAIQRIRGKIYDELRKYTTGENIDPCKTPDVTIGKLPSDTDTDEETGDMLCDTVPSNQNGPSEKLEKSALKEKLVGLIKELNERERVILSLYYYEDLNYKEIAQVLNITVSRVSHIHSRILSSLKLRLAEYNT